MVTMEKDLVIIGGGPGGYEAAIRGAQLGANVTLIEENKLGGTCLNRGCIPTKTFYKSAEVINCLKKADEFGVSLDKYNFDMHKAQKKKIEVVNKLVNGINMLLKGNGIEVVNGRAVFKGPKTLEVFCEGKTEEITASNIIIATGSSPSAVSVPGVDLKGVVTSDEVLNFEYIPKSMVILGGGVVGIEFAGIFASLGTQVTIVEFLPKILYRLDDELSRKLTVYLKKQSIRIVTGSALKEVKSYGSELKTIVGGSKGDLKFDCDLLLMAAGRKPNSEGLNLETAGIEYDKKGIKVYENYKTSAEGVYAIGDVIGGVMLAHIASEEGKVCVENIYGGNSKVNYNAIPSCVFSFPEAACVGFTEEEAKENNVEYVVGKSMFGANGKALTMGEGQGFIKVIAEKKSHKIIGVHIMGPHASDIVHEGSLAIQNSLTVEDIKDAIFAHPTLSEVFYEAVCGCIGKAIHSMPKKM
jgi:dihydrolipoamide dehydrogenase